MSIKVEAKTFLTKQELMRIFEEQIELKNAENKKLQDEKVVMEKCIYENDAENMRLEGLLSAINAFAKSLARESPLHNVLAHWVAKELGVLLKEGEGSDKK